MGAGVALVFVVVAMLFISADSTRQHIDPTIYPTSRVNVVSATYPATEIAFRAAAPTVARHSRIASDRHHDVTILTSQTNQTSSRPSPTTAPPAEPRPFQPTRLNVDLNGAEELWDRGSE